MTKTFTKITAAFTGLVFGALSSHAAATLALRVSADGGATWDTVMDNDANDADPTPGSIDFLDSLGTWTISVDSAASFPFEGSATQPSIELFTQDVSSAAGTLIVQISETGFTSASTARIFTNLLGGTTDGQTALTAYLDKKNVLFGSTETFTDSDHAGVSPSASASQIFAEGPFGPFSFSDTDVASSGESGGGAFSLTLQAVIVHGSGSRVSSLDDIVQGPPLPVPLAAGDAATIGFWHNQNGQGLIDKANGGPTSTALGTWLADNFGCLFGNLNGQPNTVVAAQFLTYFGAHGQKTYAQIMSGALAAYITSSTLDPNSGGAGFGFNISPGGTGIKTYNVGSNGTAIGLMNNTSYTIGQLLDAADAVCSNGQITGAAFNALNTIFSNINQGGDIN